MTLNESNSLSSNFIDWLIYNRPHPSLPRTTPHSLVLYSMSFFPVTTAVWSHITRSLGHIFKFRDLMTGCTILIHASYTDVSRRQPKFRVARLTLLVFRSLPIWNKNRVQGCQVDTVGFKNPSHLKKMMFRVARLTLLVSKSDRDNSFWEPSHLKQW